MNKLIGTLFTAFVVAAVVYAFSPRPDPQMPATQVEIGHLLMLDVQSGGGRMVSVGERGHIFVSDNQGANWRQVSSPTTATLTALSFIDDARAVAVGHDAVIVRTEDGGETWSLIQTAPEDEEPLLAVRFDARGHGFAVGAYGRFLESHDGGLSWDEREISAADLHLNALAEIDGAMLIAGEAGTLMRSDDGGATWDVMDAPYEGSFFGLLAMPDGGLLAFGMRGHVFRSDDGGQRWEELDTGTHSSIFGGRVVSPGLIMLVGQSGLVLVSSDQGRSFIAIDADTSRSFAAVAAGSGPGEVLLVGEEGVLRVDVAQPRRRRS